MPPTARTPWRRGAVDQRLGGQPARSRRPSAMAELLDAGAALQQAQQDALAGRPDAACRLRTASAHQQAAIARRLAIELLARIRYEDRPSA
jgi:hypothetical protein